MNAKYYRNERFGCLTNPLLFRLSRSFGLSVLAFAFKLFNAVPAADPLFKLGPFPWFGALLMLGSRSIKIISSMSTALK